MSRPTELPPRGQAPEEVLAELARRTADDLSYDSERIVGSMISAPHPLAARVFAEHLETNVGDPGLFPGTAELEQEAVGMLADLLGAPDAHGRIVSGGSEANVVALWAARNRARRAGRTGRRVVVPDHAHVSWEKAADLLDLELVHAPLSDDHVVDPDAVRALADERAIALVGVAGTTDLGAVDPLEPLSALALERGLHLHVDAAFGGFVLPFLAELGRPSPPFDLRLPGVASITIDPHKMGLAVQPAGALLFREEAMAAAVRVDVPYLAGGRTSQATITGTRPGAAALAVWALLRHLGRDGYREVVRACMERTDRLVAAVRATPGVAVVVPPTTNLVGIRPERGDAASLARRLRAEGWAVGEFAAHVRVVLLPHLDDEHLDAFVAALARCAAPDASRRAVGS